MHKIKKVVHHLRKQPEKDRRHVLHVVTFICAFLLFLIWSFTLGRSINTEETKAKVKDEVKTFSLFKDSVLKGYDGEQELLPIDTE